MKSPTHARAERITKPSRNGTRPPTPAAPLPEPADARKAARMLALMVKVQRLRDAIRDLTDDPDVRPAMAASAYDNYTPDQIDTVDVDIFLHQIADGAAVLYARLSR